MNDDSRHHEWFKKELKRSIDSVFVCARWLHQNYPVDVKINRQDVAPVYEDRMKFVDQGDLHIYDAITGKHRVEVKTLSAQFTCAEDWPHGGSFIVCAKHSFDNASPKPRFYIITNTTMTHAGIVSASTHDRWRCKMVKDQRTKRSQLTYICPTHLVIFLPIDAKPLQEGER